MTVKHTSLTKHEMKKYMWSTPLQSLRIYFNVKLAPKKPNNKQLKASVCWPISYAQNKKKEIHIKLNLCNRQATGYTKVFSEKVKMSEFMCFRMLGISVFYTSFWVA